MKVGARIVFDYKGKRYDFAAPSIIQLWTLIAYTRGRFPVEDLLTGMEPGLFVDVGANVGGWTIPLSMRHPEFQFLCLEPVKASFECLQHNAATQPNVSCLNVGAAHKEGEVTLQLPAPDQYPYTDERTRLWDNYGLMSAWGRSEFGREVVNVKRLDDLTAGRVVRVIKIDVEGMERLVLRGAERILREDRPLLQIEITQRNQERSGSSIEALMAQIESYGYAHVLNGNDDQIYAPTEKVKVPA